MPLEAPVPSTATRLFHRRWMPLGLGLFALFLLFGGLGSFRTFSSHEAFVVVPAREMLQSGDWGFPRYGGIPRLKKPPLGYWLVASSASVFGKLDEWTARFPAAVASLLLTALLGLWATQHSDRSVGFAAALINATSVYTLTYGRKAEVDMVLCLLIVSALYLIARYKPTDSRRNQFGRWTAIYALIAVAWLGKFHFAAVMVLGPCVLFFLLQRWWSSFWNLLNPIGLTLLATAVFAWPLYVAQRSPDAWSIWYRETVLRATGEGDLAGQYSVLYYFPHFLCFLLPWTPFLIHAVPASLRRVWKDRHAADRFLWCCIAMQLAVVLVQRTKHRNYILPMLPILSLLAANSLVAAFRKWERTGIWLHARTAWHASIATFVAVSIGFMIFSTKWPQVTGVGAILFALLAVAFWALFALLARKRSVLAFTAFLGLLTACYTGVVYSICPHVDHGYSAAQFAQSLYQDLPQNEPVVVYQLGKVPFLFYMGESAKRIESHTDLEKWAKQEGSLSVVTTPEQAKELEHIGNWHAIRSMEAVAGFAPPKEPDRLVLGHFEQRATTNRGAFEAVDDSATGLLQAGYRVPVRDKSEE